MDIEVYNHGSLFIIYPKSPFAKEWVDENVCLEDWQWIGPGFVCEPRYVENLVAGMIGDGLEVE
jgi:hypothetical protein